MPTTHSKNALVAIALATQHRQRGWMIRHIHSECIVGVVQERDDKREQRVQAPLTTKEHTHACHVLQNGSLDTLVLVHQQGDGVFLQHRPQLISLHPSWNRVQRRAKRSADLSQDGVDLLIADVRVITAECLHMSKVQ